MKFIMLLASISITSISYASAGCVGVVVNGECHGTHVNSDNIGSNDSSGSGYGGSSGTRYQYDLNNPSDQRSYSLDLDAQRRDQMNLNPNRGLDRGRGQRGGGIYDDN
ncbi:hypothetical protein BBC0178_020230 [Bartonella apihabitans]|uniref:Uncharacterized protein n=1 Tax=Bartonella apihabitans TaxID=2750929 RepID=A0A1U9MDC8_9HYPH|nr:hypothetical protein BBC0178_020230 [Bartonella apihabitans]AQT45705.1 hypothetical protein BBC0244_020410 [Bartonella apihabitans]